MKLLFELPKATPAVLEPYKIKPAGRPRKNHIRDSRKSATTSGVEPGGQIRAEFTLTQPILYHVLAQRERETRQIYWNVRPLMNTAHGRRGVSISDWKAWKRYLQRPRSLKMLVSRLTGHRKVSSLLYCGHLY